MYFGFDDDQTALRDAVAGFLEKRAGLTLLQQAWADPAADEVWQVWSDLAGMGVQGLMAPEAAGGSGLDAVTMALVLAEAGRSALPLPLMETAAVAVPVLAAAGDAGRTGDLGGIVADLAGGAVLTARWGSAGLAPAVSRAQWFLLADEAGAGLYRRDEVEIEPVTSVDRSRDAGRVRPVGVGTALGPAAGATVLDLGALAAAAVLVGLGRALVEMTVAYVRDRRQFGVPVGSFQAVKHQLADAAMHVEFAAPTVWAAAWEPGRAADGVDPTGADRTGADLTRLPRAVSLAKAMASDAAERAARTALQCHGAMGYTDDYHLHMWLKRVWCLSAAYGSARWHRARLGADLGVSRPATTPPATGPVG